MNAITRLENWKNAEKCRSVQIGIDDGYGATCWECVLRRGKKQVLCVDSTREHGERIEKDGNLFIRCPATDGDWPGLESVINCAIDAAEEFWPSGKPDETLTWESDKDDHGNTSWYARSAYTDDDYMFRLYPKLEDNRIVWWTDHDNELNGGEDDFYLSLEEAKAACEKANRAILEDDPT